MSIVSDIHEMIDKSANAASMAAFCDPEGGPVVAAAVASGQGVIDTLFMFLGDPGTPAVQAVSKGDLDAAISRIPKLVEDGNRESEIRGHFNRIAQFNYIMAKHWNDASPDHNPAYIGAFAGPSEENTWVTQMNGLAKPLDEVDSDGIISRLGDLKLTAAENSVKSLHIYIYGVTTFLLLVKINTIWEYSSILRAHKVAEAKWDASVAAAAKALATWQFKSPDTRGPKPKSPAPLANLLSEADIKSASPYVGLVKTFLQDFIDYVVAQKKMIQGYFDKAESEYKLQAMVVSPVIPLGKEFMFYNPEIGAEEKHKTRMQAENARDICLGGIKAALFDKYVTAHGADIYDRATLAKIDTICEKWSEALSDTAAFLKNFDGKSSTIEV